MIRFVVVLIKIHAFLYATLLWLKLANIWPKAKQHPEAELCYLKIIHIFHSRYHQKKTKQNKKQIGHILKNMQKSRCVCIHTIIHNENEDENEK